MDGCDSLVEARVCRAAVAAASCKAALGGRGGCGGAAPRGLHGGRRLPMT